MAGSKIKVPHGEQTCTSCGKRLKWRQESRGSFGTINRWFHARISETFVASSNMPLETVSLQFHEMYGGRL